MSTRSDSIARADIQSIVDAAAQSARIAGGQVSVIQGNERTDVAFGTANAELDVPMTVDTLIQIGSATKMLNAALVMSLVDEGQLELDAPIRNAVPDLELGDAQALERITLRRLLSMSAGLDNGPYTDHGAGADRLARYVRSLDGLPQAFPPGEGFGYSNAGTSVAGFACEVVTGTPWDTLLAERILRPAGLDEAATRAEDLIYHRVSAGHEPADDGQAPKVIRPFYIQRCQGPAGSTLAMTARHLADFGALMLRGGVAMNGRRVLSEATVQAMTTPTTDVPIKGFADVWGLGPYATDWTTTRAWGHSGGNRSGVSYLVWFPERDGVIAITVNTPATGQKFITSIFDTLGPRYFDARRRPPAVADPTIEVDASRYVGEFRSLDQAFDVSIDGTGLRLKTRSMTPQGDETVTFDDRIEPLGPNRFVMTTPTGEASEVTFFNPASDGRMQNLLAPVFAARRVG